MTPEQFCYWLQGFTELSDKTPNTKEWSIIKDHLQLVFNKVTPTYKPAEELLKNIRDRQFPGLTYPNGLPEIKC